MEIGLGMPLGNMHSPREGGGGRGHKERLRAREGWGPEPGQAETDLLRSFRRQKRGSLIQPGRQSRLREGAAVKSLHGMGYSGEQHKQNAKQGSP